VPDVEGVPDASAPRVSDAVNEGVVLGVTLAVPVADGDNGA